MKQSQITGALIANDMRCLQMEIDELGKALGSIANDLGEGSLAYELLDKVYKQKSGDLGVLERRKYILVANDDFSDFSNLTSGRS